MKAQPLPWGALTSHSFFLCLLCHHAQGSSSSPLVLPFPLSLFSFSPFPSSCLPVFSSGSPSLSPSTTSFLLPFGLFLASSSWSPSSACCAISHRAARNTVATAALPQKVCVCGRGGERMARSGKHGQQPCACASCGRARETPGGGSESGPGGGDWALGGGAWPKSCRIWAWPGQRQIS